MFKVKLYRHGELQIPDVSFCTLAELKHAEQIVFSHQGPLFDRLPDGNMWKAGKLAHIGIVSEVKQPIMAMFEGLLSPKNFALLDFIYHVHDFGRVIEALKKIGALPENYRTFSNHAEESVNLLEEWGVFDALPLEACEVIRFAVLHHEDSWTPEVPQEATPKDLFMVFITALLRDMDKYAIFIQKTALYLHDPEKKRQEIKTHGFAGEQYAVNPKAFLELFAGRKVPAKRDIVSFEAYMIYFISWIFDVNLDLVLVRIVDCGAIQQLLEYFRQRLPEADYVLIRDTTTAYLSERKIKF